MKSQKWKPESPDAASAAGSTQPLPLGSMKTLPLGSMASENDIVVEVEMTEEESEALFEANLPATVPKRLEAAKKNGKLDLSGLGLERVPKAALDYGESFRVVWLSENKISQLPAAIEKWQLITQLRVGSNKLKDLPDQIGTLKMLSVLAVNDNLLTTVNLAILGCKSLINLDVRNNRIHRLPVHLALIQTLTDIMCENNPLEFPHKKVVTQGKLAILKYLKKFVDAKKSRKLDLTKCGLMEVPAEIGFVGDRLVELDVSDVLKPGGISLPFEIGLCSNLEKVKFHPSLEITSPPKAVRDLGIRNVVAFMHRFIQSQLDGHLDLSNVGISDLPNEVHDAKKMEPKLLKILRLDNNQINQFTNVLGMMPNLEEIHVASNLIRSIPAAMGKLSKLRFLGVSNNKMIDLPDSIGMLHHLETLLMRGNHIAVVSERVREMPALQKIDLGENRVEKLPTNVGLWTSLTSLQLDTNLLTSLPREIGNLSRLTLLDCTHNRLLGLPAEIGGLASLHTLLLEDNRITELPVQIGMITSITKLTLRKNEPLQYLPYTFADIARFRCPLVFGEPNIETLELDEARMLSPPPEIVRLGIEAIYEYLNLLRLSYSTNEFEFKGRSLYQVPGKLFEIGSLTSLDLSNNYLKSLPQQVTCLTQLQTLILDSNKFTDLPSSLLGLTSLTLISIKDNPLGRLPVSLGNLHALNTLDIGLPGPDLEVPPVEISRKGGTAVMTYFRRLVAAKTTARLELSRLGLSHLPDEAAKTCGAYAKRLSLAHNRLTELRHNIVMCHSLRTLMLHSNALETLPPQVSALSALQTLDLEGNRLAVCPDALSSLTALTELRLGRNEMGDCPLVLCALTLLCELHLDHNRINALPNRIGRCGKLVHLSVACNDLTKLPASMKELTSLTFLNCANNALTIIPPEAGLLPLLEYADFQGNELESPPMKIVDLGTQAMASFLEKIKIMMDTGQVDLDSTGLEEIPLDVLAYDAVHTIIFSNNLLKELPARIGQLRHLRSLDISYNQITFLPKTLGECFSLEELYIGHNPITTIPWEVGRLTKLESLECDNEKISNPPEIVTKRGGKESVRYLQALLEGISNSTADLHGFDLPSMPPEVMRMHDLKILKLGQNQLSSPFPPGIAKFTRLEVLHLDSNPLIRDLPKTMRMMTDLKEISLARNDLKSIPDEVYRLTNLTVLDISDNLLDGLGALIGKLVKIVTLDLSRNQLWTLPWGAVVKMQPLKNLILAGNPITFVAASIGELTNLVVLDLSDTHLPNLVADLVDIISLKQLKLDNVKIESPSLIVCNKGLDSIRAFLEKIRTARASTELELIDFECDGGREIGISHFQLETILQSLNISRSRLEVIHQSILALRSLTFLDISQNQLRKLPEGIGLAFPFLEELVCSENLITFLPRGFGGMSSLTKLDLSKNMLETLPSSISQCTRLTDMNLTDNQVTYLPKEAAALTRLENLEMDYRFLTILVNLGLNWKMWGKPPPDVVCQGGKVVPRFYKVLITAAGLLEGKLNTGPRSTLTLSKFGLLHTPLQISDTGFFTHLVTLDLSYNKLSSIGSEISKLTNLQAGIENVPDVWLDMGSSGVVKYLQKAFAEIGVGCIDFSSCGIKSLPKDISDFVPISELFLENNNLHRLPAAIGTLTNLTNLQMQQNRISSLPRELHKLTLLKTLRLEGNRIAILPTELGLLSGLQNLLIDDDAFPGVPQEIKATSPKQIIEFLGRCEAARGIQRLVQPLPGLKYGDDFKVNFNGQDFMVKVPIGLDLTSRQKFVRYFPDVNAAVRNRAVMEGISCLANNAVGLSLDFSGMGLTTWFLYTISGNALDLCQDDLLLAMSEETFNPKNRTEDRRSSLSNLFHGGDLSASLQSDAKISSTFGGTKLGKTGAKVEVIDPRDAVKYTLDNEGNIYAERQRSAQGIAATVGAMAGALTGALLSAGEALAGAGEGKQEAVERPVMTCDTSDAFLAVVVDHSLREAMPLPICVASNLTSLNLDDNQYETLASSIGTMSSLTYLSANNNKLQSVSWRLRYLLFLRELRLSRNFLQTLPPKIGRCFRLQMLDVSYNNITLLPVTIGRLENLKFLNVSGNPLISLPHEIGGVDESEHKDIMGLKSIRSIHLRDCVNLRAMPSKLYRLTTLAELDLLGSTNLATPPLEVQLQGISAMRDFCQSLYDAENSDHFNMPNQGLYYAPIALAEVNRHVNEKQPREYVGMAGVLRHLDLSYNRIRKLDDFLSMLSNLRSLKVDHNELIEMPKFMGCYTRLGLLSVSHNYLRMFCSEMSGMQSLRTLVANDNQLESLIDGVAKLSSLRQLHLSNNSLRCIPESLVKLSQLKYLNVSGNLIPKVPKSISGLAGLEHLFLASNQLAVLPNEIGDLAALKELDLAENTIEMLPVGLGNLTSLQTLELHRNGCQRPPKGCQEKGPQAVVEYLQRIAHAEKRKILDLSGFGLTSFPVDAVALYSLTELNLSDNIVTAVPPEIVHLTRLVTLRASNNGLTQLSAILGKLTTLESLDIHKNLLTGLPNTFNALEKLLNLDLSGNKIGIFPAVLEKLTQIENLNLTDNELTRIPTWIGTYSKAGAIMLGGNQLTTVPNSIGAYGPVVLSSINLSNNSLVKVPSSLCSVITLRNLTLSGNALLELPAQIGKLMNLEELWVDSNQISRFPSNLGGWVSLVALYAHNNKLQSLPKSIMNLTRLTALTLSGNQLSELPWDLADLQDLQELWLDSNQLTTLPKNLEKMANLQDFTCHGNPFQGKDLDRAEVLMINFRNHSVHQIIEERDAKERAPTADKKAGGEAEDTTIEDMRNFDYRKAKLESLQKEKDAAWAADDFENVERLQAEIDALMEEDNQGEDEGDEEDVDMGTGYVLKVEVLEINDVPGPKGPDSKADAYVMLECNGSKQKTKVQYKVSSAVFGDSFEFKADMLEHLELTVSVMHKNIITSDGVLGTSKLEAKKFKIGRSNDFMETVPLLAVKKKATDQRAAAGSVDLKFALRNK